MLVKPLPRITKLSQLMQIAWTSQNRANVLSDVSGVTGQAIIKVRKASYFSRFQES